MSSSELSWKSYLNTSRAVGLVWQSSPGWTMAILALLLLMGLLPLASLYLMKLIVDAISTPNPPDFSHIVILISLAGLVALLTIVCRSVSSLINETQAALVSDKVQDILHAQSIALDLEYYENASYYDSLHRAQAEAPYRPIRIVNELAQLGQSAISLAGVALLLISFNWLLAAVLLIASLPAVLIRLKYAGNLYRWQRRATERERQSWYLHWLLVGTDYAKEIRLFELGNHFRDKYRDLRQQLREERLKINSKRSLADIVAQAISVVALFGALLYIAQQTYLGYITVGSLVMYFGAFQQGQSFMQTMLSSLAGLYEDNLFLSNLYEFLGLEPKVREPTDPRPVPETIKYGIAFEHVSFQYPGRTHETLQDISFLIYPAQTVALVGENGSGKTTLIKLLCRLYDPGLGRITVDGIDLRHLGLADWRKEISVVLQDYMHYNMTARENIWFGDINQPANSQSIASAAECSGADEIINVLKDGYDTILGRQFDQGMELSIGEWQKIALARAFFRPAQILVFDEPTSALDASAEEQVFHRFRKLAQGRTAIVISHRLSTVRTADCIYFMKSGRITERGTHVELMAKNGEYARLFRIQAQNYL